MLKALGKQTQTFRRSPPGQRFEARYRAAQKGEDKHAVVWQVVRIVIALVAIVVGVLASLVPGVPGFVFIIAAGALLAAESLVIARGLDRAEVKLRAMGSALKRRWRKLRGT